VSRRGSPPAGYLRLELPHAAAVVRIEHVGAVRTALTEPTARTLHAWAAAVPHARPFRGRGIAWAAPLPGGAASVVVRHNRHGGLLASLTGDRFLAPTRAPYELETALRLAAAGVATPEVIAYAVYPAGPLLARSDLATREVTGARDLGDVLTASDTGTAARQAALDAISGLLDALFRAGARHHDLNVKNVLLAGDPLQPHALVLDVDRVTFHRPNDIALRIANNSRLMRSIDKYERLHGVRMERGELDSLNRKLKD
jgi:hypothetical protein